MHLTQLRTMLAQAYSFDTCAEILEETSALYRENLASRWYFLLLNRIVREIIDNPALQQADQTEQILEFISRHARNGLDAVEAGDNELLIMAANQLTEAYSAIP
jgi:hypothetical protein